MQPPLSCFCGVCQRTDNAYATPSLQLPFISSISASLLSLIAWALYASIDIVKGACLFLMFCSGIPKMRNSCMLSLAIKEVLYHLLFILVWDMLALWLLPLMGVITVVKLISIWVIWLLMCQQSVKRCWQKRVETRETCRKQNKSVTSVRKTDGIRNV